MLTLLYTIEALSSEKAKIIQFLFPVANAEILEKSFLLSLWRGQNFLGFYSFLQIEVVL